MIKRRILPIRRIVTRPAVRAESSLMRIIPDMTSLTIRRRSLEVCKRASASVTLGTNQALMFADQLEREIVFEIFPEPVHTIVAIEAGVSIFDGVREGES